MHAHVASSIAQQHTLEQVQSSQNPMQSADIQLLPQQSNDGDHEAASAHQQKQHDYKPPEQKQGQEVMRLCSLVTHTATADSSWETRSQAAAASSSVSAETTDIMPNMQASVQEQYTKQRKRKAGDDGPDHFAHTQQLPHHPSSQHQEDGKVDCEVWTEATAFCNASSNEHQNTERKSAQQQAMHPGRLLTLSSCLATPTANAAWELLSVGRSIRTACLQRNHVM